MKPKAWLMALDAVQEGWAVLGVFVTPDGVELRATPTAPDAHGTLVLATGLRVVATSEELQPSTAAPDRYPFAVAFEGWRFLPDVARDTVVVLHPLGSWFEVDRSGLANTPSGLALLLASTANAIATAEDRHGGRIRFEVARDTARRLWTVHASQQRPDGGLSWANGEAVWRRRES